MSLEMPNEADIEKYKTKAAVRKMKLQRMGTHVLPVKKAYSDMQPLPGALDAKAKERSHVVSPARKDGGPEMTTVKEEDNR